MRVTLLEPEIDPLPVDILLRKCRASVRRLASEPVVLDSRLVSVATQADEVAGAETRRVAEVVVREVEIEPSEAPSILEQWSSEHVLDILPECLSGAISRKTLAPAHIAIMVETYRLEGMVDLGEWLGSLAAEVLTRSGGGGIGSCFDEKVDALVSSGTFLFRNEFGQESVYGRNYADVKEGLPDAPCEKAALQTLILRHLARLGFGGLEAAYLLTLARAEFDHAT